MRAPLAGGRCARPCLSRAWLVLAALFVLGFGRGCFWSGRAELRIAAGGQGSATHGIATALADLFNDEVDGVRVTVAPSDVEHDSLQRMLAGHAELAVAYSDSEGDGEIRTLVPLYELYLYIVVWDDAGVADVPGLAGKKVGTGPAASGTDALAGRLLSHYGFGEADVTVVNDSHRTLSQQFLARELDAVLILGSIESKAVERMLAVAGTRLLSLDDPSKIAPAMDGIRTKHPNVVSHVVPKHLFGDKPKEPTGVIGVNALLLARADLSEDVARELTRSVFQHRTVLGHSVERLRELDERFDPHALRFPLHPGASQYYRRDEPPAILEWADTISLFITVALLAWSAVLALAAGRRRRRKGQLDGFYTEFQAIVGTYDEAHETPLDQMSDDRLDELRDRLQLLRRRAFDALMGGDVEANSAFVVFHDYLRWELQDVERIQRERRGPSAAPSTEGTREPEEPE